jgi:hypothetical protein
MGEYCRPRQFSVWTLHIIAERGKNFKSKVRVRQKEAVFRQVFAIRTQKVCRVRQNLDKKLNLQFGAQKFLDKWRMGQKTTCRRQYVPCTRLKKKVCGFEIAPGKRRMRHKKVSRKAACGKKVGVTPILSHLRSEECWLIADSGKF